MLDFDLAMLYGVETKSLNQSVKRNIERFPEWASGEEELVIIYGHDLKDAHLGAVIIADGGLFFTADSTLARICCGAGFVS